MKPTYSFEEAMAGVQAACSVCGAVVVNHEKHTDWHAKE